MASKVLNRCSGVSALNSARSSDTLPHANTGPGLLIGDFHCDDRMLSPAGPGGERYQVLREVAAVFRGGISVNEAGHLAKAAHCCTAKRNGVLPHPSRKRTMTCPGNKRDRPLGR